MERSEALHHALERILGMHGDDTLPSSRVERIIVRPEWNVVIAENGLCGMVINFYGKYSIDPEKAPQIEELSSLVGLPLSKVAEMHLDSGDENLRSISVCSLSALSQPFLGDTSLLSRGHNLSKDVVDLIRPTDIVAIVGYGGIVDSLKPLCSELHVTEMRPRHFIHNIVLDGSVRYCPDDVIFHSQDENEDVLSSSDVVLMTASTLVNGTFDKLLDYGKDARVRGIYGPSGSLLPDALFELGIDTMWVCEMADPAAFARDALYSQSLESSIKRNQRIKWVRRA
ncbi:MAG: hypothetical protein JW825_07160 [Candidatus Methanofastidiosa archaeon]|nr:hypothetical protein [Candidatus Methanofastidiosa archaeon]